MAEEILHGRKRRMKLEIERFPKRKLPGSSHNHGHGSVENGRISNTTFHLG